MNDLNETLHALKSLKFKNQGFQNFVEKLSIEDLEQFAQNFRQDSFLPEAYQFFKGKRKYNIGLLILNYLYSEEEIRKWYTNCLNRCVGLWGLEEVRSCKTSKIYYKILGMDSPAKHSGLINKLDKKFFQKMTLDFRAELPYPDELIKGFLKVIETRKPLTEALKNFWKHYTKNSMNHSLSKIIDKAVVPVTGLSEVKEYLTDMIDQFKTRRMIDLDIPISPSDFSYFLTGSASLLELTNLKPDHNEFDCVYLTTLLPEIIHNPKIDRFNLYKKLNLTEEEKEFYEQEYCKKTIKAKNSVNYKKARLYSSVFSEKELTELRNIIIATLELFKPERRVPGSDEVIKIIQTKKNSEIILINKQTRSVIIDLIKEEIEKLKLFYYKTRKDCIDLNNDYWVYYYLFNDRIYSSRIDFSIIKSSSLKKELKEIFEFRILKDEEIGLFKTLINYCTRLEELFGIKSFDEITSQKLQVLYHELLYENSLKPTTISGINGRFVKAFDILASTSPELYNSARDIHVYNKENHSDKTEIIPDEVYLKITEHLDELPESIQLIFEISMITGWRFKEVINLRPENFRKVEGYPDLIEVETTITKTASKRKAVGYPVISCDFIPVTLYNQILRYLEKTQTEREWFKIESCFYLIENNRAVPVSTYAFNKVVNDLIKIHNIKDKQGNLWHFSSKQTRKKVAVDLIRQGVPLNVVQQKLNHQHSKTTQTYYTETEKIELAEVNEKYFQKFIEKHLSQEVQSKVSQEELKKLFLDFNRVIKLDIGLCSQPLCSEIIKTGCSNCSRICTGNLYLKNWEELLQQLRKVRSDLEKLFLKNKIDPQKFYQYQEYQILLKKEQELVEVINAVQ